MDEEKSYIVEVTTRAKLYYYECANYFYDSSSIKSAESKSEQLLALAMSLSKQPNRGSNEDLIKHPHIQFNYLLFEFVQNKFIKIIYYIEEDINTVYVTDFFPCSFSPNRLHKRLNY